MIGGKGFILGGLPVYASVRGGYDSFSGEHWSEVDSIRWMKRNGKPGKEMPSHLWDKALDYDHGFGCLIENVCDDYQNRNSIL